VRQWKLRTEHTRPYAAPWAPAVTQHIASTCNKWHVIQLLLLPICDPLSMDNVHCADMSKTLTLHLQLCCSCTKCWCCMCRTTGHYSSCNMCMHQTPGNGKRIGSNVTQCDSLQQILTNNNNNTDNFLLAITRRSQYKGVACLDNSDLVNGVEMCL